MILIDLDAVKTKEEKQGVIRMVAQNLCVKKLKSGEPVYMPTTPIYWFTKHKRTIDELEEDGYPRIGTVMHGPHLVGLIRGMIQEIDKVAKEWGMEPLGRFRRPVQVLTNSDFGDIEALGATPMPVKLLGGHGLHV